MSKKKRQTRTKAEIAEALDISASTLKAWLKPFQAELEKMGVSKFAKVLNPKAVKYICFMLDVEFED